MTDATALSRAKLLELVEQKDNLLAAKDELIQRLEQESQDWKLAYEKLWHQRFPKCA